MRALKRLAAVAGLVLTGLLGSGLAQASMPIQILNANDAALYGKAIVLASAGKTDQVKPLLAQVQDASLVGTVQALSFATLVSSGQSADWLAHNADLPAAAKIADQLRRHGEKVTTNVTWSDTLGDVDSRAVAKSNAAASRAVLDSGLADWQHGDWEQALGKFTQLTTAPSVPPSLVAAGAYWASRAALRAGHPEQSSILLHQAADHPSTFYGVLARRALGLSMRVRWESDGLNAAEVASLAQIPGGKRALALVQVGHPELAEPELRGIFGSAKPDQRVAILRLTAVAGLTVLGERMDHAVADADGDTVAAVFDAWHYPVPPYAPTGGWKIDRALVYAFMRQESSFNPKATSEAGARGLMQMMPATAAALTGDSSFLKKKGKARKSLNTPAVSLNLGQLYLARLFSQPDIAGSLIQAAVAYQAGPGNLAHWRSQMSAAAINDPLLFLESLPSHASRQYAKRVIVNLWIYRSRLGESTETLDAVIEGGWPRYAQLDPQANFATKTAAK